MEEAPRSHWELNRLLNNNWEQMKRKKQELWELDRSPERTPEKEEQLKLDIKALEDEEKELEREKDREWQAFFSCHERLIR
jgi:hypothetical protein